MRYVLALIAILAGAAAAEGADRDPWQSWLGALGSSGYSVEQGGVFEVDNAACSEIVAVFGTCFGNNAAAPYIIPQVPIDGTYVDPFYAKTFTTPGATGRPSNMFYRLADTEALVTLVSLPPRAAYFGYQSYLFSRETSAYSTSEAGQTLSPDPKRYEIFGSLGNDINNVVVGRQIENVWNGGIVVFITTSNERLSQALVKRAAARGLNTRRIFVEPVGAEVRTGTGRSADDLVTLIRYAVAKNADAAAGWMDQLPAKVRTYRVSAAAGFPVERFATPAYTRKKATSEAELKAPMAELVQLLRAALRQQEGPGVIAEPMITSESVNADGEPTGLVGQDCIAKGTNCLGDNQDTDAYRFGVIGKLASPRTAFVVGVDHTRTGNASYISLAVYDMSDFTGIASASQTNRRVVGFDSGVLSGSAAQVLRAVGKYGDASARLKAALPRLYVSALSRDCPAALAPHCIDLGDTAALPASAAISVTQRAYMKPHTSTGADPDAMLTPVLIFRPGR